MWMGHGFKGNVAHFINNHYEDYAAAGDHKEGMIRVSGVTWLTNLDHSKRHEDLILYKKFNKDEYLRYDNYDAINVDKTKEIPMDYKGIMGVPITFMYKYNPDQFEIMGMTSGRNEFEAVPTKKYKDPIQINSDGTKINGSKANTSAAQLARAATSSPRTNATRKAGTRGRAKKYNSNPRHCTFFGAPDSIRRTEDIVIKSPSTTDRTTGRRSTPKWRSRQDV